MLTLFTYADISAVHPHALTPWKAENLWRLYLATANYLDRSVDEERVGLGGDRANVFVEEFIQRVVADLPEERARGGAVSGWPAGAVSADAAAGAGAGALSDGGSGWRRMRCSWPFTTRRMAMS